jgi:hypothetical protein
VVSKQTKSKTKMKNEEQDPLHQMLLDDDEELLNKSKLNQPIKTVEV